MSLLVYGFMSLLADWLRSLDDLLPSHGLWPLVAKAAQLPRF